MANLSQNNCNIIAKHFLNKCLDYLQKSLRKAEQNYKPSLISYKTISRLLYILQGHEAAFNLRSKIENKNLAFELFWLFKRVRTDSFNYQHYWSLSQLVIKKAFDVDI